MRHRAWALLLLVPATMFVLVVLRAPFATFHGHLVFAGTPKRFAATVVRAGRADARGAIWLDNAFVASWLLVVPKLLRLGLERWCPERRRRFGLWHLAPGFAITAAVLDAVENGVSLSIVGKHSPASVLTLVVSVVGWSKWVFYAGALVGAVGLVVGPVVAPAVRPMLRAVFGLLDRLAGSHPPAGIATVGADETAGSDDEPAWSESGDALVPTPPAGDRIGIAVSGGGIRAASVALGALRQFDRSHPEADPTGDDDGPSLFRRARWLTGVSGGAYTAGGWRISRRPDGSVLPLGDGHHDGLFDEHHPWAQTVRRRRRFLDNGVGSIAGGVANALLRTFAVLGGVLSATFLIGWGAGQLVQTRAVHSWFPYTSPTLEHRLGLGDLFPLRIIAPGGAWLAAGVVVLLVSLTRPDPDARAAARRIAIPAVVAGVIYLVVTVGVPAALIEAPRVFRRLPVADGVDEGAGVLGALSSIGVVGALTGAVVAQVKRRWLRLGGVFLAIALVLLAGKVADTIAFERGGAWVSWPIGGDLRLPVAIVALLWLGVLDSIASHRLTLGGLYRKRLAATFALGDGDAAPLPSLAYSDEPLWPAYQRGDGPELIIVATAHSSATTFSGVKGLAFTFRPDRVTLFDRTDGTSAWTPMGAYPTGSWWDGYPRGWLVSRSMALTGGAFASAMGRQALGTTQALLVALNLRLGAWVPNPRFVEWFADPHTAPRVHLGYLAKELFGRYDPSRDPFVYVADGGHRENLGLVELLRERPDVVCCIDASGDRPGTFQTLKDAIELAAVELDVDIDLDLGRLRARDGTLPADCAAAGIIRYPVTMGGGAGRLLYGRYQLSEAAAPALLQYAAAHPRFPNYSTADQFLSDDEHAQLVALGEHVAARIVDLFAGVTA